MFPQGRPIFHMRIYIYIYKTCCCYYKIQPFTSFIKRPCNYSQGRISSACLGHQKRGDLPSSMFCGLPR